MNQTIVIDRSGMLVRLSGTALKAACVSRGWSLAQLSRQAKVSRPTIAQAVRNAPIRPLTAWKIARALSAGEVPITITGLMADDS